ncbi:hypothetical protein IAI10_18960 [Clostridium sp. 19966]|uniref:hypothetical protein n=1 Tax=Clostridium sp. 19966 TaxID=2768166 RepID=UPI0028E0017E|nr:hypothetical protein [Clostridium sp. 19966]MDT8718742.1 hypothetical protein [Clostridium sp. 19966]
MSKYKVGDELIIVKSPDEEKKVLNKNTHLNVTEDNIAHLSWALKILKVEYDKPNVTLTYKNPFGEENKVFAVCKDITNFDHEKVLEKALLKAFQNELNDISVSKNNGVNR